MNSDQKGKRAERELAALLSARFSRPFSRIPQSGNRYSQVQLPDHVKPAYVGDLVTPPDFRFAIEAKCGYPGIDLGRIVATGQPSAQLDKMLDQAQRDADRLDREPLLALKQTRRPWVVFTRVGPVGDVYGRYRDWWVVSLDVWLRQDDAAYLPR